MDGYRLRVPDANGRALTLDTELVLLCSICTLAGQQLAAVEQKKVSGDNVQLQQSFRQRHPAPRIAVTCYIILPIYGSSRQQLEPEIREISHP